MKAESGHTTDSGTGGVSPQAAHEHARPSMSPPQAPALEHANPRQLYLIVVVAIFVTADVAELIGVPLLITATLFLIGVGTLLLLAFTLRVEDRLADAVDHDVERGREEFEALSDRMWELQESEE